MSLRKAESIEFAEPIPALKRSDTLEVRKRILELTLKQAKELGISSGTLHYLREHAGSDKMFKVYRKVATKLGIKNVQDFDSLDKSDI